MPVVMLLCPGIFNHSSLVDELSSLLSEHQARRVKLIALYSTELAFGEYIKSCPQVLRAAGLFESVMFGKWPESAELRRVAAETAIEKLKDPNEYRRASKTSRSWWDVASKGVQRALSPNTSQRPLLNRRSRPPSHAAPSSKETRNLSTFSSAGAVVEEKI